MEFRYLINAFCASGRLLAGIYRGSPLVMLPIFVSTTLLYKGYQCADPLLIVYIVIAEEFDQLSLFNTDSVSEEHEQHGRINKKTERITQHELRAQAPVEEAKVARMSYPPIDTSRHEKMRLRFLGLNLVVETSPGVQHRQGANGLADEDHEEANEEKHAAGAKGRPVPAREKDGDDDALYEGG